MRVADARVEILQAVEHLRHRVAYPVVVLDVPLPGRAAAGQRGLGHAGQDRALRPEIRRYWLLHPMGDVHHRHRVLDADSLRATGLQVRIGPRQAGQDQRLLAVHDVATVQLGRDVHGQIAVLQRLEHVRRIRRGQRQVTAQADEHLHPALVHRLDRPGHVEPVLARRIDMAHLGEPVEELLVRAMVDPERAVTLHVAVAAHRARPGSLTSDVAAEQHQVEDLPDRVHAMLVLRDAQAPGDDHPPGLQVRIGEPADRRFVHAGASHQLAPGRCLAQRPVLLKAMRIALEELPVEHRRVGRRRLTDGLGHPPQEGHVAADPYLHDHRADLGGPERRHVGELVRHDRPPRRRLDQRVDVHQRGAPPVGLGQPGEHPRRVRGGVVAHQPDRVRLLPVTQIDRALAGPQRGRHGHAACLVAHVRAIRQIIGAELPHP